VVEQILDRLLEMVSGVCREFGGTNRVGEADSYCLTFPDPGLTLAAVERLAEEWAAFERGEGLRCPMNVAVHKGVLYAYRSYLYSRDLAVAVAVESATSRLPPGETSIFVTERVRQDLVGTPWEQRLQAVDMRAPSPRLAGIVIYRLGKAVMDSHAPPPGSC
jgi:hypothetical protein